jgi:hypothetical protein
MGPWGLIFGVAYYLRVKVREERWTKPVFPSSWA